MAEHDQERHLPATPRRIEKAREEGSIARSRELAACLELAVGAGVAVVAGGWAVDACARLMRAGLTLDRVAAFSAAPTDRLATAGIDALVAAAPLLLAFFAAAAGGGIAIGGWLFVGKPLVPDFSRLDPMRGLGRMLSLAGLVELGKTLAKTAAVAAVAVAFLWAERDALIGLASEPPAAAIAHSGAMVAGALLALAGAAALIAAVDVPIALWRHGRELRMSREDLREELRESEGDPQLKARIRGQQREAARRRMMAEVPKADVVVTNPTHFACALAYRDGAAAPRVVAKGRGLVAARIRATAEAHSVALLEAPPLARALYHSTEIGDEIPPALYAAVAQVLAYVYQLRRWRSGEAPRPAEPAELAVPPGLDPGAES